MLCGYRRIRYFSETKRITGLMRMVSSRCDRHRLFTVAVEMLRTTRVQRPALCMGALDMPLCRLGRPIGGSIRQGL